jgi:hypothetical protein
MIPRLSNSGLSILLALLLALWEVYFFGFAGQRLFGALEGTLRWFTPDRLGSNLVGLVWIYLSFQLVSIPFSVPKAGSRFIGVLDGMASIVPLSIALVVVFGRHNSHYGAAMGSGISSNACYCDGPVWRLCLHHRPQPPDVRCPCCFASMTQ